MGNPATFDVPLRDHRVPAASPARVVRAGDPALLAPFVDGARALERTGVMAITTSCGFLPGEGEGVDARDCESGGRPPIWDRADSPKR